MVVLLDEFPDIFNMREDQSGFFDAELEGKFILGRGFDDDHRVAFVFGFRHFGHTASFG